jgi:NAD(P)-dependent dehydrogenase (short-subunit alcohol dehydrogenase family)
VPSKADALRGKVILVTGAGSGIGAAGAQELHRRGAVLSLLDCDAHTLAATAAALGGEVSVHCADVCSLPACEAAVAAALARHGRIDVVWANAGVASMGPLAYTDPAAWKRCIDVNVLGVFNTVRAALPAVTRQRGYVAVTASVSSFAHPPMMSAYAASKAAVEAMCNAWRIELAAHGVGVGTIHAHWVSTPLVSEGALHPAFVRLRRTMPALLNRETSAQAAAVMIADGIARRDRRIWVPGWVRALHWLRAALHTPWAERELLRAAPEMEVSYLEGLAAAGAQASSFGPRERERASLRAAHADAGETAPPAQDRGSAREAADLCIDRLNPPPNAAVGKA